MIVPTARSRRSTTQQPALLSAGTPKLMHHVEERSLPPTTTALTAPLLGCLLPACRHCLPSGRLEQLLHHRPVLSLSLTHTLPLPAGSVLRHALCEHLQAIAALIAFINSSVRPQCHRGIVRRNVRSVHQDIT